MSVDFATLDSSSLPLPVSDGGASLTVDGGVSVSNFPAIQPVSGTVAVSNLPAIQPVITLVNAYSTYGAQIVGLVPAAATTDFFTITGSATKTVVVTTVRISGITTAGSTKDVVLVKRSTANSAGTSTTPIVVPFDSVNAAGTAVVRAYTANPTLGTSVGAFKAFKFSLGSAATIGENLVIDFDPFTTQGLVLRGTSQVLSLNGNGVAFAAGANLDISIEWIEF